MTNTLTFPTKAGIVIEELAKTFNVYAVRVAVINETNSAYSSAKVTQTAFNKIVETLSAMKEAK